VVQQSRKLTLFDPFSNVHLTSFYQTSHILSPTLPAHQASFFALNAILPELRQRHFSLPTIPSNRPPIILRSNSTWELVLLPVGIFKSFNFLPLPSFPFFPNTTLPTPCRSPKSRSEQVAPSFSRDWAKYLAGHSQEEDTCRGQASSSDGYGHG
jgi:hypothetical protein